MNSLAVGEKHRMRRGTGLPLLAAALLPAALLVVGSVAARAAGQEPATLSASPTESSAADALANPPAGSGLITQSISVAAGTGLLLHLTQPAATILSADPTIARVQPASPSSLFLMGVAQGQTTVIATNQAGSAIEQFNVMVTPGLGRAMAAGDAGSATVTAKTAAAAAAAITTSVQGATGIAVRATGNGVVLTGTVLNAQAAQQAEAIAHAYVGAGAQVMDQLVVLGNLQVNVRVRIAEIDRSITRQLGFNWQALGNSSSWTFGLMTGVATAGAVNALEPLGLTGLTGASTPYQVGSGFTSGNGLWDVNSVIDALAADQLVTILAEPNLTAQSGETASFLAGGEFPVPVAGSGQNGTANVTIDYKQYGVSLALVPTVLSPTRLNLRIRPEVSQLTSTGAISVPLDGGTLTIPALTVRRAETTVELGSGQSFAIAGLLQRTSSTVTNALPGLGELPVIGALFRSNDFQRGESELVIIVTPYIVRPTSDPHALRAPTDGFVPATDLQRILFGRQMASPMPSNSKLDVGFVLK